MESYFVRYWDFSYRFRVKIVKSTNIFQAKIKFLELYGDNCTQIDVIGNTRKIGDSIVYTQNESAC